MRGLIFGDLERWASAATIFAETSISTVRWIGVIVAGFVLAFGIWQVREQRDRVRRPKARFGAQPEKEFEFLKRQAFRRMQTGGLAAIVGFLMLVGLHVPAQDAPGWWASAWLGVLFFSGWAALLALVDATSTWLHYSSESAQTDAEKILLEYQMKKMREQAERAADDAKPNPTSQNEKTTEKKPE
ncbi:MAG: hypothetical protein J6K20_15150 [Thermoguttaceae bacterium]|nr:hypothetical protein [Thermoguttaceae bacterium]